MQFHCNTKTIARELAQVGVERTPEQVKQALLITCDRLTQELMPYRNSAVPADMLDKFHTEFKACLVDEMIDHPDIVSAELTGFEPEHEANHPTCPYCGAPAERTHVDHPQWCCRQCDCEVPRADH